MFAAFVAYLSCAQQVFQEAYATGALFPLYFAVLALAIGAASLANGRLVMKYGMQRLVRAATMTMALISAAGSAAFAFGGLPPLWLFTACLFAVFLCIGLLFGNLIALAMEPLGHIWLFTSPASFGGGVFLCIGLARFGNLIALDITHHRWKSSHLCGP